MNVIIDHMVNYVQIKLYLFAIHFYSMQTQMQKRPKSKQQEPPPSSSRPAWWSSILSQSSRISSLSISSFPLTILAGWMVVYVVYEIFSLIFGRLINEMIGGSRERKLMLLGFTKSSFPIHKRKSC